MSIGATSPLAGGMATLKTWSSPPIPTVRTGTLSVLERTAFAGKTWKSKGVVLDAEGLTIHQPATNRHVRLPLSSITELERTDLMPHSLRIKSAGKTYHLAFQSDGELYDWRDDIYCRCPLGAQTTSPFNFKHTAHIDNGGATGSFSDSKTVPLFEQMVGRSIPSPAAVLSPGATTPRSRPGSTKTSRRRSNPMKGHIMLNNNNNINIEGAYFVKQTGMFAGWYWKERWLSLKGSSLIVHTRKTKTSPPSNEIPLSTVKNVEPDAKRSNSLLVTTTNRETCINILFDTDNDLYAWREAIYLRSGLSSDISTPTDFVHDMHVTFDASTGELKGLPDQWKSVLNPTHSTHTVQLPIQPSGLNTHASAPSTSRRSQPRVAELLEHMEQTSPSKPASSPLFSNLTRVPPPSSSADTEGSSVLGRSSGAYFVAGTSASSDNTLFSTSPPMMSLKGKVDELSSLRE